MKNKLVYIITGASLLFSLNCIIPNGIDDIYAKNRGTHRQMNEGTKQIINSIKKGDEAVCQWIKNGNKPLTPEERRKAAKIGGAIGGFFYGDPYSGMKLGEKINETLERDGYFER